MRLLVVDDSPSIVKIVREVLEKRLGCESVYEANDGGEAWDIIRQTELDGIICDWQMKKMHGVELLAKMRENPKYAELPFLMISGRSDRDAIITAIQAGVSEYIVKPFTPKDLIVKLRKILFGIERRKHLRMNMLSEIFVRATVSDSISVEGKALNVGEGGLLARLKYTRQLAVYDEVDVVVRFTTHSSEEHTRKITCRLLRIEWEGEKNLYKSALYAFSFLRLDFDQKKFIADYLDKVKRDLPELIG